MTAFNAEVHPPQFLVIDVSQTGIDDASALDFDAAVAFAESKAMAMFRETQWELVSASPYCEMLVVQLRLMWCGWL